MTPDLRFLIGVARGVLLSLRCTCYVSAFGFLSVFSPVGHAETVIRHTLRIVVVYSGWPLFVRTLSMSPTYASYAQIVLVVKEFLRSGSPHLYCLYSSFSTRCYFGSELRLPSCGVRLSLVP